MIGLALETEQDLRVHQVAGFAHVAADIAGGFEHGRRARGHRQAGEALFHLLGERRMIDRAGGDHEHPVGGVVAREIVADLARREALDGIRRAEDRPSERLAAIGDLGKLVEHNVVGRVVGRADLLQDDVFFAPQFFLVERRFRQDVGENIDRERHMVPEHAGIIGGGFRGCRGVEFAADIFDFLGDVACAAAGGALEGHVLEEVGDPVFVLGLVTRSGLDPDTQRDALQMRHGFGDDRQPGGEPGDFYIHLYVFPAPPILVLLSAGMLADESFDGLKLRLQDIEALLPLHKISEP